MSDVSHSSLVEKELHGRVAVIRLNDPDRLNPLSHALQEQLLVLLKEVAADSAIRCLVLTGNGRAFCVGADLSSMDASTSPSLGTQTANHMRAYSNPLIQTLRNMPCPVLSAVNGPCAGAGVGLALAADICVAAESAYFLLTFMPKLGIVPDLGATWFLEHLVGRGRAMGMALLGDRITAAQSREMGLIWQQFPDTGFFQDVLALAQRMASLPRHAATELRQAFEHARTHDLASQLAYEADRQRVLIDQPCFQEGVTAFLEKRNPQFS